MYFWVNQGKTYKEEKEGGYLWAPIKNSKGDIPFHWVTMKKLNPGDIVFNYRKGFIVGYCNILSESYEASQPDFNTDAVWENSGYMADANYVVFYQPIPLESVYKKMSKFLPEKYSPIYGKYNDGKLLVKANQGYLYSLDRELGEGLAKLANVNEVTGFDEPGIENRKGENYYNKPDKTSSEGLVTSRVGQGQYRRRILERWNYQCAVTGCKIVEILIASHIVPWRDSSDEERLDVDNGILLSPVVDALFDKNFISFEDDGKIILSKFIKKYELELIGIFGDEKITGLTPGNKRYLKRHRSKLYKL